MGVGDFKTEDDNPYPLTLNNTVYGQGYFFTEYLHFRQKIILKVKIVIRFLFRNYQCMSPGKRIYIQESEELFTFGNFITGYLTLNNTGKY